MDADLRDQIALLHRAPYRCVLAVAGGGAGAVASLLSVPGGSRTLLEAVVPYAEESLCEFLGRRPDSFCSVPTSRAMAIRARAARPLARAGRRRPASAAPPASAPTGPSAAITASTSPSTPVCAPSPIPSRWSRRRATVRARKTFWTASC